MFNKKDYIYRKRSYYSQEGCDHAINLFEKRIDLQEEGTAGNQLNYEWKKCTEIFLKKENYTLFEDLLLGCKKDYIKEYPITQDLFYWSSSPTFKIQKYLPEEGYFVEHFENDGEGLMEEITRTHAWMIYLNDVSDGGYTYFPHQKRKFQPRRGDFLMWPAYFTHSHHGITSKTQTKYIATGWYNVKND